MAMKADVFAARSNCAAPVLWRSTWARASGDDAWKARAALLTPIAKAFGTDTGIESGGQQQAFRCMAAWASSRKPVRRNTCATFG